jgi:hypothetical protein
LVQDLLLALRRHGHSPLKGLDVGRAIGFDLDLEQGAPHADSCGRRVHLIAGLRVDETLNAVPGHTHRLTDACEESALLISD